MALSLLAGVDHIINCSISAVYCGIMLLSLLSSLTPVVEMLNHGLKQ